MSIHLILFFAACFVQDDIELRLMNVLTPVNNSRHVPINPYIVALTNNRLLEFELGLTQNELDEINQSHQNAIRSGKKILAKKYKRPPKPQRPNTNGLDIESRIKLKELWHRSIEQYDEGVDQARTEFNQSVRKDCAKNFREFSTEVISNLSTDQRIRYGQIILQSQMGQNRSLGIYFNQSLRDWVGLSPKQFEALRLKAKEEQATLVEEIEELVLEYHKRIQNELDPPNRELVGQTLKDDPNWTAEPPTQVAYKFLSRKYLIGLRILGVYDLMQRNVPLKDGIGIRDYLEMVEEQVREVDELVKSVDLALPSANSEDELTGLIEDRKKRIDELDRRIVEEILLPHQSRYLARQIILATLNKPTPFGLYRNDKFVSLFELESEEAKRVAKASLDEIPNFQRDLRSILNKSHERVRRDLPPELKREFRKAFGDATMFVFDT